MTVKLKKFSKNILSLITNDKIVVKIIDRNWIDFLPLSGWWDASDKRGLALANDSIVMHIEK